MRIAVTDANIFIDLIKLDLLSNFFLLDIEFHTTLSVTQELKVSQYEILLPFIENEKIIVHELNEEDLFNLIKLDASKKLSTQDLSVIYLSTQISAFVLTGDNLIRKYCQKNLIEVYGILWIFDQLVEQQYLTYELANARLELLLSFNNRLPKHECDIRLKNWKSK